MYDMCIKNVGEITIYKAFRHVETFFLLEVSTKKRDICAGDIWHVRPRAAWLPSVANLRRRHIDGLGEKKSMIYA